MFREPGVADEAEKLVLLPEAHRLAERCPVVPPPKVGGSPSLSRWGFMGLGRFCQTLHVVSKVVSGYGKVYNLEVDESR